MWRSVLSFFLVGLLGVPAVASAVSLEGELTQGALVVGQAPAGARVALDGEAVRVAEDGHFLLGFARDAAATAELRVEYPDGRSERRTLAIAPREYDIQRIDGLPQRKVTPKPEDLARIRADSAAVALARKRDDARTDFLSGWRWPVHGRISGVYGSQRILNGNPRRPHFGVDIAAPEGTPVAAPADGVVSLLHPDMFYSGVTLLIDHGHGLSTAYLHLRRAVVEEGQRVRQGEVIGEVGATGRATGPHLHWGMNLFKTRLDPSTLVGPMPVAASAEAG
jgi:murein DD-endopeptidase MepM/ murein hydrolase activator NlpD